MSTPLARPAAKLPAPRNLALFAFVAVTFVTVGRPPGAVQLRTGEVETFISAIGKGARDLKYRSAWIEPARA